MLETISSYLHGLGAQTFTTLWIPLLLWTVVALPTCALLRWRTFGTPYLRYYLLQALLLALPAGLLLGGVFDLGKFLLPAASASTGAARSVAEGSWAFITLPVPALEGSQPASSGWDVYHLAGLLTTIGAALAGWRLVQLAGEAGKLYRLRSRLSGRYDRDIHRQLQRLCRQMQLRTNLRAVVTSHEMVPMTFGFYRPTIIIPAAIASRPDQLRMTLVHELTHIRRRDYLRGWAEQLISRLLAVQPLTGWLRRQISSYREMTCDMEVLGRLSCGKRAYAALLFQIAVPAATNEPLALAMSDSTSNLKRRILAMKKYAESSVMKDKTIGSSLGLAALIIIGVFTACTDVAAPPRPNQMSAKRANAAKIPKMSKQDPGVFIVADKMPKLKGGISALQQKVDYPEKARKAGVEGRVIVQFIVDRKGNVVAPKVLRGIGAGCDQEALEVVRQAQFEPGMQQGQSVPVKISLPVRFSLGTKQAVKLYVGSDETVRLGDEPVPLANLSGRLKKMPEAKRQRAYVYVEGKTPMGLVADVQRQIHRAQITRISFHQVN